MKVLGKERVTAFCKSHSDCKVAVSALILELENSDWKTPTEIKQRYPKASIVGNNNIIFNICGNKYRLWIKITYKNGVALIVKIGTHKEYDKWEIL
jgi:mRNA interferase HigB